jgi:hypothetical protein
MAYISIVQAYLNFSSRASPEWCIENLHKDAAATLPASYNHTTQSCIRQLARKCPDPQGFIAKYEELKAKE